METGKIADKAIHHCGDEVLKIDGLQPYRIRITHR
jgi:hypothetical protein